MGITGLIFELHPPYSVKSNIFEVLQMMFLSFFEKPPGSNFEKSPKLVLI